MNCIICGKEIAKSSYSNAVLCGSECFAVNFWNRIVQEKGKHVFINGCSYYIENEQSKFCFRGFGGRKFVIEMFDTRERITTTNLWYQGEIPVEFKEKLPDTARFIKQGE